MQDLLSSRHLSLSRCTAHQTHVHNPLQLTIMWTWQQRVVWCCIRGCLALSDKYSHIYVTLLKWWKHSAEGCCGQNILMWDLGTFISKNAVRTITVLDKIRQLLGFSELKLLLRGLGVQEMKVSIITGKHLNVLREFMINLKMYNLFQYLLF